MSQVSLMIMSTEQPRFNDALVLLHRYPSTFGCLLHPKLTMGLFLGCYVFIIICETLDSHMSRLTNPYGYMTRPRVVTAALDPIP